MSIYSPKPLPNSVHLRRCVSYNPDRGEFVWRTRPESHFRNAKTAKNWNRRNAGESAFSTGTHGYTAGKLDGVTYFAHRVAWKYVHGTDPKIIDHINGCRSDNRICNLRSVTQSENVRAGQRAANPAKKHQSIRGIIRRKTGWTVYIYRRDRRCHIGLFPTFCKALHARIAAEVGYGR